MVCLEGISGERGWMDGRKETTSGMNEMISEHWK